MIYIFFICALDIIIEAVLGTLYINFHKGEVIVADVIREAVFNAGVLCVGCFIAYYISNLL
jgi:hypothetical protein